jgi:thioredoxin 1
MIEILNDALPVFNSGIQVVVFSGEWCTPCKRMAPMLESFSSRRTDIAFYKVDTEKNLKLTNHMDIYSLPTIIVFKDGLQVRKLVGTQTESNLENLIDGLNQGVIEKTGEEE